MEAAKEGRGHVARIHQAVQDKLQAEGLNPRAVKGGHSFKYRLRYKGRDEIWALKVCASPNFGWLGFGQKKNGAWPDPLSNVDRVLFVTTTNADTPPSAFACFLFTVAELRRWYAPIQDAYNARGGLGKTPLWGNVYDRARPRSTQACQVNLARGQPPLWMLPYDGSDGPASHSPEATAAPTLAEATLDQIFAELRARGVKTVSLS